MGIFSEVEKFVQFAPNLDMIGRRGIVEFRVTQLRHVVIVFYCVEGPNLMKNTVAIPSLGAMGVHIECKIVAPLQFFFLDVCHISYI